MYRQSIQSKRAKEEILKDGSVDYKSEIKNIGSYLPLKSSRYYTKKISYYPLKTVNAKKVPPIIGYPVLDGFFLKYPLLSEMQFFDKKH